MRDDVFDEISPDEALIILKKLTKKDADLKIKVIELAENLFRDIDISEIWETVFYELDGIDVHDLWDRSGQSRYGYVSPEEMSVEMFEAALEPFIEEMKRLSNLRMHREALLYCMGILKGIYRYEEDSDSEFKDWVTDVPAETFGDILKVWKKKSPGKHIHEMDAFLSETCPGWYGWAHNLTDDDFRNS